MTTSPSFRFAAAIAVSLLMCAADGPAASPAPATLRAQLKTVAVMPVTIPADVPNRTEAALRIERSLETRLAQTGITVIPASEMRALRDNVRSALGGYYDPHTGDIDEQRSKLFDEHVNSEFRRRYPADAWLYSRIEPRRAQAQGPVVMWDGVVESPTGEESVAKMVFGLSGVTGTLGALSFHVGLLTPMGEAKYHGYGALQLLEYYDADGGDIRFVPVREDAILTDPAREQRAISLALDPLLLDDAQREAARAINKEAWKKIKPVARGERPRKPADVDRAIFLTKYPRVAIAAVDLPELPNRAEVRARYAAAVEAGLTRAGFLVVPPSEYAAVWDPIYAASGGFYDPLTGELLTDKRTAAMREAFAKLGADSPVDVVFVPSIVIRQARIESGKAKWDGRMTDLQESKAGALFDKSRAFGGTIPAASLELRALDSAIEEVFLGYGAIELLAKFKSGGIMSQGGFDEIPVTDWLVDPAQDEKAVDRALGSLAQRP